jgi:hypothetical protein
MQDERNFVASHEVQEFDDRVGNGSDVYNATNIKHAPDKKHGNIPKPADEKQYKQANEQTMTSSPRPVPRPGRTLPSGGYQYPNGAVEPGPGFRPLSTDTESGMTSSPIPKPRPARLSSNSTSNTSMETNSSNMSAPSKLTMTSSPRPKPRPVFAEAKKEYEEDATDEKEMMTNQLNFIKLASEKIKDHINSIKDPEEWFQNKLSGLHANMKDLHAYVAGEKEVKEESAEVTEGLKYAQVELKDVKSVLAAHRATGESARHMGDGKIAYSGKKLAQPVDEEAEQIDELDKKTYGSYAKKAKDDLGKRESQITRNRFVDPKGVKDPIKHNNSLLMKRAKRRDYINKAIDKLTNEEAEGDPRVEPKDVKSTKGKSLKMITGQVKESNYNGSRTKTGTEQARARFDKKMERKEIQKDQEDDN